MIEKETVEKPCLQKSKLTAGSKTGEGGGTWELIPSREVDDTLLCGAANGGHVQVKSMFALVGGPPPLRASEKSRNLLGLPLAGGVQFELRPQVGPLSLRCGGHWP